VGGRGVQGDRARYKGNQPRVGRHTEQRVTACTFEIGMFQDDEEERWRLPRWLGTSSNKPNSVDFQSKGSPRIRSPVGSGRFQSAHRPSSPAATSPAAQRQIGGIDPRPTAREERDGRGRDRPLGGGGRLDRNAEQMHWMHWGRTRRPTTGPRNF